MKKNVFSICGYSCAGKSTIIKQLIDIYDWYIIRYGDIHREAVKKSGYNLGIDWIKDKGFEEYECGAIDVFKKTIEECEAKNIIVDGIFSNKCFQYLKDNRNINLTNILLETTYESRLERAMKREGYTLEKAKKFLKDVDWLKYNAGLSNIMKESDYIINSNDEKSEIKRQIVEIMQSRMQGKF